MTVTICDSPHRLYRSALQVSGHDDDIDRIAAHPSIYLNACLLKKSCMIGLSESARDA